jgi:hypothetical protein
MNIINRDTMDNTIKAYSGQDGWEVQAAGGGGCACGLIQNLGAGWGVRNYGAGGGGGGFIEFEINDLTPYMSGIQLKVGESCGDIPQNPVPPNLALTWAFGHRFWAYLMYARGGNGYIRIIETVKTIIPTK